MEPGTWSVVVCWSRSGRLCGNSGLRSTLRLLWSTSLSEPIRCLCVLITLANGRFPETLHQTTNQLVKSERRSMKLRSSNFLYWSMPEIRLGLSMGVGGVRDFFNIQGFDQRGDIIAEIDKNDIQVLLLHSQQETLRWRHRTTSSGCLMTPRLSQLAST